MEEVVAKVLRRAVSDEQVIVFYLFVCFCGREEEEEEDLQAEVDNTESRKSMFFFLLTLYTSALMRLQTVAKPAKKVD